MTGISNEQRKSSDAVVSRLEIVFYAERIVGIDYSGEYADFFLSENYRRARIDV